MSSNAIIKNPIRQDGESPTDNKNCNNSLIVTASDDFVNTLQTAFKNLVDESKDLTHGVLSIEFHIRDKKLYRYVLNKQLSFLSSGANGGET
jgi:hypothetical protein